jgi:protein-S-isoprenylcysteine O-methyltransferase Ste14
MDLRHFIAYTVLLIANVLGGASLVLFGLFLFGVSFARVDLWHSEAHILAWDSLLCLMFFVQHSGMVRKAFRRRMAAWVPEHYHGALYTVASAAALFVLVLFWQSSTMTLLSVQGVARWLMQAMFFASLLGMFWGMLALRGFDAFGNQAVIAHISGLAPASTPFAVRGPYRWVRHPLYFFTLVMIWTSPDITLDRLLFNVLFTGWIVVGTRLEERDLVAEFGEHYSVYQRHVPMLIPYKLIK